MSAIDNNGVYHCTKENAPQIYKWMMDRGGIDIWDSANLSNPGMTWTVPIRDAEGNRRDKKPTWEAGKVVASYHPEAMEQWGLQSIVVDIDREVKRFRVAVRRATFSFKLTDAASRKVRETLSKLGEGHSYNFDYSSQEVVFFKTDSSIPLTEYMEKINNGTSQHPTIA